MKVCTIQYIRLTKLITIGLFHLPIIMKEKLAGGINHCLTGLHNTKLIKYNCYSTLVCIDQGQLVHCNLMVNNLPLVDRI